MDSYPKRYEIEIVDEGCSEPYSYMLEDDFGDWVLWEDYEKLLEYSIRSLVLSTSGYSAEKIKSVILDSVKNQDEDSEN